MVLGDWIESACVTERARIRGAQVFYYCTRERGIRSRQSKILTLKSLDIKHDSSGGVMEALVTKAEQEIHS